MIHRVAPCGGRELHACGHARSERMRSVVMVTRHARGSHRPGASANERGAVRFPVQGDIAIAVTLRLLCM
jgi:hypothetical protein